MSLCRQFRSSSGSIVILLGLVCITVLLDFILCAEANFHHTSNYRVAAVESTRHPMRTDHQVLAGRHVKFKCEPSSCDHDEGHYFVWEFLPCGKDYKTKCPAYVPPKQYWKRVPNKNVRVRTCSSSIAMTTRSTEDSGFYRCSLINSYGDVTFVQLHHLNVVEQMKLHEGSAPEFINFEPTNVTVQQGERIVMQCKVYSLLPVEIRWFKESQEGFVFKNTSYIRLNSSNHIFFGKDIYQSKLVIEKATESDSGIYKCAAINSIGPVHREAYVNVIGFSEIRYWPSSTSLPMLFLIPIGMALIPILMWLWYYRRKNMILRKEYLDALEHQ